HPVWVDYEPHPPETAISTSRQKIVDFITALYSGSASDSDIMYAEQAIYDNPWSY
ncbi:hypothetical protein BJ878DRAFT_399198, partial [Calycina marina]